MTSEIYTKFFPNNLVKKEEDNSPNINAPSSSQTPAGFSSFPDILSSAADEAVEASNMPVFHEDLHPIFGLIQDAHTSVGIGSTPSSLSSAGHDEAAAKAEKPKKSEEALPKTPKDFAGGHNTTAKEASRAAPAKATMNIYTFDLRDHDEVLNRRPFWKGLEMYMANLTIRCPNNLSKEEQKDVMELAMVCVYYAHFGDVEKINDCTNKLVALNVSFTVSGIPNCGKKPVGFNPRASSPSERIYKLPS